MEQLSANCLRSLQANMRKIIKGDTRMTYTLYKLENTKARLCAGHTITTDKAIADMVKATWEVDGYIVSVVCEV